MNQSDLKLEGFTFIRDSNFDKVKGFHKAFGHLIGESPGMPDAELIQLRIRLVMEESAELLSALDACYLDLFHISEAKEQKCIAEVAKELADLLYVVYGFFAVLGVDADAVFAEVHRSNMSKLGEDGRPAYREDGKVLKGPNFSPADVRKVIYGDD